MTRQTVPQYGGTRERATRRQHKHDMLLTFMVNATEKKRTLRPAAPKPKMLQALLSMFL